MALLALRDISHRFAGPPVLDGASLQLERGDRVCIFGRNGEGKSTLMRIVSGQTKPDAGAVDLQKGATLGQLEQEVPEGNAGTVFDVVVGGLGAVSQHMRDYHDAIARISEDPTEAAMNALERAQAAVDAAGGWQIQERVETVLSRLGLDGDAEFETLSGGWRRRAFLAAALVQGPDVLLLDEPTNHLDIEAIEWLEGELQRFGGAVLFVTHDRAFLRAVATRIVELDRGKLKEYPGNFDLYVEQKEHDLEVEQTHAALFDKKLAEEEKWIRTGVKARRTRNEGRVRALEKLRAERSTRRNRKGTAKMDVQVAKISGKDVISAKGLSFGFEGQPIVNSLDLEVRRGDRIGLVGPNGAGKTTLLRLLLGELEPSTGDVSHGTKLEVGYYDQLRNVLDPTKTVTEVLVEKGDHVEINGQQKHVIGYLRDFLFDDIQARVPVSVLSGGERNRLLLARLFSRPANVLVLDEPTNDLDIDTLELLEDKLLGFPGTVLLVSHDREFLDNVVTESLIFEGDGVVTRLVGGYDEWRMMRAERREAEAAAKKDAAQQKQAPQSKKAAMPAKSKLSHKESRELADLPKTIDKLETEQAALQRELADADIYKNSPDRVVACRDRLAEIESALEVAFARWEALEAQT